MQRPWFEAQLEKHGGVLHTAELYAHGETQTMLRWAVKYGTLVRVRRGLYCSPQLHHDVVRALRVGGRLACVSALAHLGLGPRPERLHVAVPANTPRVVADEHVVVHWSRRALGGDRVSVGEAAARRQAVRCRALARDSL